MSFESRRCGRGFILVGVIWTLAIFTVLATGATLWMDRYLTQVEARRQAFQRELEERSMLARVQWLVATQRYTVAGVTVPHAAELPVLEMDRSVLPVGDELPLDGRLLCLDNGWCVALVDHASRVSLTNSDPGLLRALLVALGVSVEDAGVMVSDWLAYFRPSTGPRLGSLGGGGDWGGSGSPRQRVVHSVMEVFRLASWQVWEDQLMAANWPDLVTAEAVALNFNTVHPKVLALVRGGTLEDAEAFPSARRVRPIMQQSELRGFLGQQAEYIPFEAWTRLASDTLAVRLFPIGATQMSEYDLRFNSNHILLPPWQRLAKRSINQDGSDNNPVFTPGMVPDVLSSPLVAGPG